jgi:hypothetical protein
MTSFYRSKIAILKLIEELQSDVLMGEIPSSYGCMEIERLTKLLRYSETDLEIESELRLSEIDRCLPLLDEIS